MDESCYHFRATTSEEARLGHDFVAEQSLEQGMDDDRKDSTSIERFDPDQDATYTEEQEWEDTEDIKAVFGELYEHIARDTNERADEMVPLALAEAKRRLLDESGIPTDKLLVAVLAAQSAQQSADECTHENNHGDEATVAGRAARVKARIPFKAFRQRLRARKVKVSRKPRARKADDEAARVWKPTLWPACLFGGLILSATAITSPWSVPANIAGPLSDVLQLVAAAAAAAACFRASTCRAGDSDQTRVRLAWFLLGTAAASWAAGQGVWTVLEVGAGRSAPFPSLADVGYLLALPLTTAALLVYPAGWSRRAGRARSVIEIMLTCGSLLLIMWLVVIPPVVAASDGLARWVAMAYPLGDVVNGSIALVAMTRSLSRRRTPFVFVVSAIALLSVSDVLFLGFITVHDYQSADMLDLGWITGYGVLALAALYRPRIGAAGPLLPVRPSYRLIRSSLPYGVVGAAIAVAATSSTAESQREMAVTYAAVLVLAYAIVRDCALTIENRYLFRRLRTLTAQLTEVRADNSVTSAMRDCQRDITRIQFIIRELGDPPDGESEDGAKNVLSTLHARAGGLNTRVAEISCNADHINDRLASLAALSYSGPENLRRLLDDNSWLVALRGLRRSASRRSDLDLSSCTSE